MFIKYYKKKVTDKQWVKLQRTCKGQCNIRNLVFHGLLPCVDTVCMHYWRAGKSGHAGRLHKQLMYHWWCQTAVWGHTKFLAMPWSMKSCSLPWILQGVKVVYCWGGTCIYGTLAEVWLGALVREVRGEGFNIQGGYRIPCCQSSNRCHYMLMLLGPALHFTQTKAFKLSWPWCRPAGSNRTVVDSWAIQKLFDLPIFLAPRFTTAANYIQGSNGRIVFHRLTANIVLIYVY